MSWRSRRILGLVQQPETSQIMEVVSTLGEMGGVDNNLLPEDGFEESENIYPSNAEFKTTENDSKTINKTDSAYTEKPAEKYEIQSPSKSPQKCHEFEHFNNDDPLLLTTVETINMVNESLPVTETKINLVPDYDSDGISYEDEVEHTKEIEITKLNTSLKSSSTSSSTSSSSSNSSSSSSDSDSSSSTGHSDEQTRKSINSRTNLASAIIRSAAELKEDAFALDAVENTDQRGCRSDTLTDNIQNRRHCAMNPTITISPIYTDESDLDDDVDDPTFTFENKFSNNSEHRKKNFLLASSSDSSNSDIETSNQDIKKRGRKRLKNPAKWRQNKIKRLRNEGKAYVSMSKTRKHITARCLKTPCTDKCRLKCTDKIDTQGRYEIFVNFWEIGDIDKQRAFINTCMTDVKPKYKYTNAETPRRPNKAFYFTLDNNKIRICKTFFKSTLDITDRMINTIITKTNEVGFVSEDKRGKHGHNKKLDPELVADIRKHIESIPRIDSHYVRAKTTREYIDGGKTIKDLYKDFVKSQTEERKEIGHYFTYYKIFTTEYNLSFHRPKKDQCDLCVSYANSSGDQKLLIEEKYKTHMKEKELSRSEKLLDRKNATNDDKVVIYDLEAVLQCPRGETSAFYYKSKLNSYNLTLTELKNKDDKHAYDNVHCYFWTESDAKRGAVEIGSCVWEYLKGISCDQGSEPKNIIFYSDNCCGQNKNKFIATLYMYAVYLLNINSITHKFLIRGHTQNEADSVHSLIEKEVKKNLKSGPIYTPDQYITLIKSAKKSSPAVRVHEMTFDSFVNLKELQEEWGYNFNTNTDGQNVNWNDIKQLKITKEDPFTFYYKTSYEDEAYREVNVRNKRKKMKSLEEIMLKQAYTQKQELSANKKKDLKELITKGLIPPYYANFYNSII